MLKANSKNTLARSYYRQLQQYYCESQRRFDRVELRTGDVCTDVLAENVRLTMESINLQCSGRGSG